ncbi:MAG: SPOR domain-containing protein [Bacteroidales bacterium]|nr:SPOR domain-containing protein [Bacteroidales bacterium]
MSKLRFFLISISLIILVNSKLIASPISPVYFQSSLSFFGFDLTEKTYYEEIFNKDERKELKKSYKYLQAANKYMTKYDADQQEIEKLYTIAEATSSAKSREKSLKNARKLEIKSLKNGYKALDYFKKATDIQNKIYITALNRERLKDDSKNSKLGRELELQAKSIFETAKTKEQNVPQHDDRLKFIALKEVNELVMKSLSMQEKAFGFYENDPAITSEDVNIVETSENEVVKLDSVLFPVYEEQYNALKDPNLYHSKANLIIPRLNLTKEELASVVDANRKNKYANTLLLQVDETYRVVDSLNFVADRTEDFATRDALRSSAIEKEQTAFYKLTNATNIYLDVNDIRYQIYKKHFSLIDPKIKASAPDKAKKYESEADVYYTKAKKEIALANKLMFRSEQYLKLMAANDLLLFSLQLQESAYGVYFNLPEAISAEIDTALIDENSLNNTNVSTNQENTSSGLSWDLLATYTYSKEKPRPVKYVSKKGIVFLVQIGIFKGLLPPEKFANVKPLVFEKFAKNPYRRYLVGEYKTTEAAELALEKVKALGYADAYIISFVDGERRSYSYGQAKVNTSDKDYIKVKQTEIAKIGGTTEVVENKQIKGNQIKTATGENSSVTNTKGLLYFVQLGMYVKPLTNEELKNLQPIFTEKIQGKGTRYLYGNFGTIAVARNENQKARNLGFKDSYVTAYYDGVHIALDRAKKIEKQQYGTISENTTVISSKSSTNISFMVQVGAYRESLNNTEENKLKSKFSPRNVEHKNAHGMNIYFVGNYKTYKEADYLKKKLIGEGHKDVFVIAFDDNEKISVGEAIKRNK